MPSTKPLINLVMDPELVERIDDFRFANRFPSRAAAIKWLLTWALDQRAGADDAAPVLGGPDEDHILAQRLAELDRVPRVDGPSFLAALLNRAGVDPATVDSPALPGPGR